MQSALTYLEILTRETRMPEPEVMAMAFRTGLCPLWREHIMGRYLRDEISRNEAINELGVDWVELAERQHKAMKEDMNWALKG